ncbi:hypothetical protein [Afifella pfennigii]|uniref:hypothetical protein n=1 Tax=Afifella pfennigii TaxID=209897 RepID=UPI00047D566A|nr:hypothetical protein [Afifella pfennigii]
MAESVGILAYGSLIENPGDEIASAIIDRREVMTPFKVEFARTSRERAGAPTLVPVTEGGASVRAMLLVLNVSEQEATDRLYRREINQVGSDKRYQRPDRPGPNTVVVRRLENFEGVDVALYTEIAANISNLSAEKLATFAIKSARELGRRDGISYLIDARSADIVTPLTTAYEEEIKRQSEAGDLEAVRRKAHGEEQK